ncbi:MAG: hypothetical protein Q8S00_05305 [Deltaproteobacteria bacterium]|nr:hypothetical protein [Deltaproteobacteria bacterium]
MQHEVAIFTHQFAQEVDGVIDILRLAGSTVRRINLCQYPENLTSSFSSASLFDDFASLNHASVGWIHEPYIFTVARSVTGLNRDAAMRECSAFWDGIIASMRCPWLNSPASIRIASNKVFQLQLAAKLGIAVPDYIISNDINSLRGFRRDQGKVVMKALSTGYVEYGRRKLKVYTQRLVDIDAIADNVKLAPIILQCEVDRTFEVRTTVVDGQAFSVEFDWNSAKPQNVDIRELDYVAHRSHFHPTDRFPKIEEWSRKYTERIGLGYACYDWLVDNAGHEWFLECNPLGSFKWSELCGCQGISAAISDALLRRCVERSVP